MPHLTGIIPPLVTPLLEPDRLDRPAVARLIDKLISAGVSGIFTLGTTGEGPALSTRLKREMVAAVCEAVRGRVRVLVGVSDPSFAESLALADHAARCHADAIVATPFLYFSPRQVDVVEYFRRLSEAAPLPVMLYDMPSCARASISWEAAAACTELPRVIGIKDSSGSLESFRRLLDLRIDRPDWSFLIGPELYTAEAVLAGGDGSVSGGANLLPELFVELYDAAEAKDLVRIEEAQERARCLSRLYQIGNDSLSGIRGLKCALALRGECRDVLASPYAAADESFRARVREVLEELCLCAVEEEG